MPIQYTLNTGVLDGHFCFDHFKPIHMPTLYDFDPWDQRFKLCEYNKSGTDYLSKEIGTNFKGGDENAIFTFGHWMTDEIKKKQKTGLNFDYVVRVIGSSETIPVFGKPLCKLGQIIEAELGIPYVADFVAKTVATKKMSRIYNASDRRAELKKTKFYINHPDLDFSNCKILVIDDIKTTGNTAKAVCKLIKDNFDDVEVYLFTIAENNNNIVHNEPALEATYKKFYPEK